MKVQRYVFREALTMLPGDTIEYSIVPGPGGYTTFRQIRDGKTVAKVGAAEKKAHTCGLCGSNNVGLLYQPRVMSAECGDCGAKTEKRSCQDANLYGFNCWMLDADNGVTVASTVKPIYSTPERDLYGQGIVASERAKVKKAKLQCGLCDSQTVALTQHGENAYGTCIACGAKSEKKQIHDALKNGFSHWTRAWVGGESQAGLIHGKRPSSIVIDVPLCEEGLADSRKRLHDIMESTRAKVFASVVQSDFSRFLHDRVQEDFKRFYSGELESDMYKFVDLRGFELGGRFAIYSDNKGGSFESSAIGTGVFNSAADLFDGAHEEFVYQVSKILPPWAWLEPGDSHKCPNCHCGDVAFDVSEDLAETVEQQIRLVCKSCGLAGKWYTIEEDDDHAGRDTAVKDLKWFASGQSPYAFMADGIDGLDVVRFREGVMSASPVELSTFLHLIRIKDAGTNAKDRIDSINWLAVNAPHVFSDAKNRAAAETLDRGMSGE